MPPEDRFSAQTKKAYGTVVTVAAGQVLVKWNDGKLSRVPKSVINKVDKGKKTKTSYKYKYNLTNTFTMLEVII